MKATLHFDLPEDAPEFKLAQQGADWCSVVWHFWEDSLRRRMKYVENLTPTQNRLLDELSIELFDLMREYGVSLEETG